ncbi:MAG: hypothetical protein AAGK97_04535, partial [Bacteroidota bacterium]
MKRITVKAYEIALVWKRGKLVDVFTEGKYWIGWFSEVKIFDITSPVPSFLSLPILLEYDWMTEFLQVEKVNDHEIGIELKDGLFNRVLQPGKYAYWRSPVHYEVITANLNDPFIPDFISRSILKRDAFPKSLLRVFVVESFQKGLLFLNGEYQKTIGPGTYFFWKTDPIVTIQTV